MFSSLHIFEALTKNLIRRIQNFKATARRSGQ